MLFQDCPKCSNHAYEIVCAKPIKLKHQILVVQCALCKHVIGTLNNDENEKLMKSLSGTKSSKK